MFLIILMLPFYCRAPTGDIVKTEASAILKLDLVTLVIVTVYIFICIHPNLSSYPGLVIKPCHACHVTSYLLLIFLNVQLYSEIFYKRKCGQMKLSDSAVFSELIVKVKELLKNFFAELFSFAGNFLLAHDGNTMLAELVWLTTATSIPLVGTGLLGCFDQLKPGLSTLIASVSQLILGLPVQLSLDIVLAILSGKLVTCLRITCHQSLHLDELGGVAGLFLSENSHLIPIITKSCQQSCKPQLYLGPAPIKGQITLNISRMSLFNLLIVLMMFSVWCQNVTVSMLSVTHWIEMMDTFLSTPSLWTTLIIGLITQISASKLLWKHYTRKLNVLLVKIKISFVMRMIFIYYSYKLSTLLCHHIHCNLSTSLIVVFG